MNEKKRFCMQCMLEIDEKENICPYCGYSASSKQAKPFLPQGITVRGRYLTGKILKRNVDSAIYIGRDTQLGKTVEIREFFPTEISKREDDMTNISAAESYGDIFEEYRQSFIHLWKNLMRFKGLPALLDVYDVFEENNTAYAVTDHNDSTTFRKILDTMRIEDNPFSLERTRTLIMPVLSTVESLHTANVVHRGISPETLVLSSDGTLKITGFAIPQVRTTKNRFLNSVCDGYAPIEQYDFNWQQGSWTDIYSIGALIYKMLTGRTLPPAPSRLNDEALFFTQEETERIPNNIIALMRDSLILMPQGRIKDIHEITNVFLPDETSKKTVSAIRRKIVLNETKDEENNESNSLPKQIPLSDSKAPLSKNEKVKEIVKPKQAQPQTKTSQPKTITNYQDKKLLEEKANEEKRLREELLKKQQLEHEKMLAEEEKRRIKQEEELRKKKQEKRLERMKKTAAANANNTDAAVEKRTHRQTNPVSLAVAIGVLVSITCVLLTFLLYGTLIYRFVDAPVLDNCLSVFSFLPVNSQNGEKDIEYVKVADFRTLTKEYIENDALYNKKYKIVFEYDYSDTVEKGYVFSQSVESGSEVPVGSTIIVYISKGIEMIPFINVSGKQFDEAQKLLSDLGFVVTREEVYNLGIYTQDKVISSSLKSGEEYPKGTEVTLKVWGAPPVTLPFTSETQTDTSQAQENNENDRRRGWFSLFGDIFDF